MTGLADSIKTVDTMKTPTTDTTSPVHAAAALRALVQRITEPKIGQFISVPDGGGMDSSNRGIDTGTFNYKTARNWERPGTEVAYVDNGDGTGTTFTPVAGALAVSVDSTGKATIWKVGTLFPLNATNLEAARAARASDITKRMIAAGFTAEEIAAVTGK